MSYSIPLSDQGVMAMQWLSISLSQWFPNVFPDLLTLGGIPMPGCLTGLAIVTCFLGQGPHTTSIIKQEVTVYFDFAHGMGIEIFIVVRHTWLTILFPVYSHIFTSLQAEKNHCQSSKEWSPCMKRQRDSSSCSNFDFEYRSRICLFVSSFQNSQAWSQQIC